MDVAVVAAVAVAPADASRTPSSVAPRPPYRVDEQVTFVREAPTPHAIVESDVSSRGPVWFRRGRFVWPFGSAWW